VASGRAITLKDNYVSGAHINYLIGGLDVVGTLVASGNSSIAPRLTDWEAAKVGCWMGGVHDEWGLLDFAAHDPTIEGWVDRRVHCER
jgi:hypothetical protein